MNQIFCQAESTNIYEHEINMILRDFETPVSLGVEECTVKSLNRCKNLMKHRLHVHLATGHPLSELLGARSLPFICIRWQDHEECEPRMYEARASLSATFLSKNLCFRYPGVWQLARTQWRLEICLRTFGGIYFHEDR